MRELALFAGAGGGLLASRLLRWRTVCAVEVDPICRALLLQRQRDRTLDSFPIWDDVCTFDGRPWRGAVDVVSGGFPCQPFSYAARGRHSAPDLWPEMLRVIDEVGPRFVFAENVRQYPIQRAASDLNELGYACRCVELSAADVGADHIRKRYWLVGDAHPQSQLGSAEHGEMARLPERRANPWSAVAWESGVPHGPTPGVAVAAAAGNMQVPVVAALAWRVLTCSPNS